MPTPVAPVAGCGARACTGTWKKRTSLKPVCGADAAPVGCDRQLDVLRLDPAEADGRVGGIAAAPRRLAEFRHVGHRRPGRPVGGGLDRDFLGAEAEEALDRPVGVPDLQLVQLVDLVELVLDPVGLSRRLLNHIVVASVPCRSPVRPEPSMVFSGPMPALRTGGGGRRGLDRIAVGLDGERPDVALEDRVVGRLVDFIDPPEVGLAEFQSGRVVRRRPSGPGWPARPWGWSAWRR